MAPRAIPEDKVQEVVEAYKRGATGTELAKQYGCQPSTIYNVLRENDVEVRPRGRRPVEAV